MAENRGGIMKKVFALLSVCILFLGWLGSPGWADGYNWTTVDYAGASQTYLTGMDGTSVVGYTGNGMGFLYQNNTWTRIGYPGANANYPTGIENGKIVGIWNDPNAGAQHGFYYDGSAYTKLEYPFNRIEAIPVGGINGGRIYGYLEEPNRRGFVIHNPPNGSYQVGNPGGNKIYTYFTGGEGSTVIGGYYDLSLGWRGFIFNGSAYSELNAPNSNHTTPESIENGIIVGSYYDNASARSRGFIYNGTWATVDFPNARNTFIMDIDNGNLVGYYTEANGDTHGFLAAPSAVPAPGAVWLLASGLIGLVTIRKRFRT